VTVQTTEDHMTNVLRVRTWEPSLDRCLWR